MAMAQWLIPGHGYFLGKLENTVTYVRADFDEATAVRRATCPKI